MQFFMSYFGGQLKQQIFYSFILLISYIWFIILFKWLYKVFPILMVEMFCSQIQQAPGPTSEKKENPGNYMGLVMRKP